MNRLQTRLDNILERIDSHQFRKNEGLAGDIGFWIFDYPAKDELQVREHLQFLTKKLNKRGDNFLHLNLLEVIIDLLKSRNLLERTFQRELQVGSEKLIGSLSGVLKQDKVAQFLVENYQVENYDFLILYGLGSAWPLLRGHEILSALQDVMGQKPLLLFYPGEYSGQTLHLFGTIESNNHYRAFKLVPDQGIETQH